MANLRFISFTVVDSTHITAKFNYAISPLIGIANINVTSETNGVLSPDVLEVSIFGNTIEITLQPLVSQATYTITFASTTTVQFKSLNGDAIILNDGITNKKVFVGPIETSNPIKDSFLNFFKNNVYDLEQPSVLSTYIDGLSLALSRALHTIGQIKNDNYLSFTVTDELKTRGLGA
jgi:hypothetical protein